MTGWQWLCFATSLVSLLSVALAVQFNWLKPGKVKTVVVFIAGLLTIVPLWAANLPPKWFAGTKVGFGLGLSLFVTAWLPGPESERGFRFPLFLAIGSSLLIFNFLPHL